MSEGGSMTTIPTVDLRAVSETLGLDLYELANAMRGWGEAAMPDLSERGFYGENFTLDEFDAKVAAARRHIEGAIAAYRLWSRDMAREPRNWPRS